MNGPALAAHLRITSNRSLTTINAILLLGAHLRPCRAPSNDNRGKIGLMFNGGDDTPSTLAASDRWSNETVKA